MMLYSDAVGEQFKIQKSSIDQDQDEAAAINRRTEDARKILQQHMATHDCAPITFDRLAHSLEE